MATTLTPNALAAKLAGQGNAEKVGKTFVRPFLRRHFPRATDAKGTGWYLTEAQVKALTAAFKAKQEGKSFDFAAWQKAHRARKPKATVEA